MILDIFKDALEYSAQDWKALIKLGIISILGFLILPIFLYFGYSYRVTKISVEGMIGGGEPLPDFSDIIQMFVDGLKVFLVYLVYGLIVAVIFLVFVAISGSIGDAGKIVLFIGVIVTLIVGIFAYLMSMMGVANMAANGDSLSKAFDFKGLIEIIKSIGILRLIVAYIGVGLISALIYILVGIVIMFLFGFLGISGSIIGLGDAVSGGILSFGVILSYAVIIFIAGPYIAIMQSRANGLLYNLH